MKVILRIILGLSLICATCAWAVQIQGAHSGSWWNSAQSGHGFSIEVLDDRTLVAYWFVYSPTGEPTFLLAVADIKGSGASGPVYQYSGMRFGEFDPETLNEEFWGSMSIEFTGCDTAHMVYESEATHDGHVYGSGTIDLSRLTAIHGLQCDDGMSSTTGYWEVTWSDLVTAATHTGTAIADDSGLVTISFPDNHLIGTLTRFGPANKELALDARLDLGPLIFARELSLDGQPTETGFRFTSDTDEFEFTTMTDRPNVTVSQAYLDGMWDGNIEMIDGEFSWDTFFIDVWLHNTLRMTIPSHGGNTIPFTVTTVPWPDETMNGHAFYWRDDAAGMEYLDLHWVWGEELLSTWTMERSVP